jgi:hypothetical protein
MSAALASSISIWVSNAKESLTLITTLSNIKPLSQLVFTLTICPFSTPKFFASATVI